MERNDAGKGGIPMVELSLLDGQGEVLDRVRSAEAAALTAVRAYQPGDQLVIVTDQQELYVSVDAFVTPAYIHVPQGRFTYVFPTQDAELQPYAPQAFRGELHTYTAAPALCSRGIYRNLALNPVAQREFGGAFPFVSANVETRDESVFFARNVIDGCLQNHSHGMWPYQSWGIGLSECAEITLDFGREVKIDKMRLVLRADFPHDAYWRQGTVSFSDGTKHTFSLTKTDQPQEIPLERVHLVRWMKMHHLVKQVMDSPFPALTEWEVWGWG